MLGEVKNLTALATISPSVRGIGKGKLSIDYMGGLWVLISRQDGGKIDPVMLQNMESWFRSIKPWEEGFTVKERVTWLSIEGLPVEGWNQHNLNLIVKQWGEPIFTQDCSIGGRNLSKGKVCIKTSQKALLTCTCKVEVGGNNFIIRIIDNGGLDLESLEGAMIRMNRKEKEEEELEDDDEEDWEDSLSKSSEE
ncbi:hypothetical protein LXL04_020666 [Taraxacum kok-saghyz]